MSRPWENRCSRCDTEFYGFCLRHFVSKYLLGLTYWLLWCVDSPRLRRNGTLRWEVFRVLLFLPNARVELASHHVYPQLRFPTAHSACKVRFCWAWLWLNHVAIAVAKVTYLIIIPHIFHFVKCVLKLFLNFNPTIMTTWTKPILKQRYSFNCK